MGDIIYVDFTKTVKENLLRSKEEYEKLRTERSQTFMLAAHHETESFLRVGVYNPDATDRVKRMSDDEYARRLLAFISGLDENK